MRWACLFALAAATLLGEGTHQPALATFEGTCMVMNARGSDFNDRACLGAERGSFNATMEPPIRKLEECAQLAKDTCGEKAVFISFHKGEPGYLQGSGECAWFGAAKCACTGYQPASCKTSADLNVQYVTARIGDVLQKFGAGGNGVEPPANAADPLVDPFKINGTMEDPTVTLNEARNLLLNAGQPEKATLMTIPDATELDMKMLRESPKSIFSEAEKVGQVAPECPGSYAAAKERGEWQCMKRRSPVPDVTMYITASAAVVCCMCTFVTHLIGRRIRSSKRDDDDDGEYEEEEEEYTEE